MNILFDAAVAVGRSRPSLQAQALLARDGLEQHDLRMLVPAEQIPEACGGAGFEVAVEDDFLRQEGWRPE